MAITSLFLANMRLHTMRCMVRADVREKALQACYGRAWKLARRAVEPAMDKKSRDSGRRKLRSGRLVSVPSVDACGYLLFILEIDNLSWRSVILLIFSTRSWEHPFQISI